MLLAERRVRRPDPAEGIVVGKTEGIAHPGVLRGVGTRIVDQVDPVRAVRAEHLNGAAERGCLDAAAGETRRDPQGAGAARINRQECALLPDADGERRAEVRHAADQDPVRIEDRAGLDECGKQRRNWIGACLWRRHVQKCADLRQGRSAGNIDRDDAGVQARRLVRLRRLPRRLATQDRDSRCQRHHAERCAPTDLFHGSLPQEIAESHQMLIRNSLEMPEPRELIRRLTFRTGEPARYPWLIRPGYSRPRATRRRGTSDPVGSSNRDRARPTRPARRRR
jgi:hypothetical protein